MTFEIPRPAWIGDRIIAERGEHAQFQMYTREGNDAVALMLTQTFKTAEEYRAFPSQVVKMVKQGIESLAEVHPEVHDTEPQWAIVDAVNAFYDTVGFAHIGRDDL